MIPEVDVRGAYLRTASTARGVLAAAEVATSWDADSVLARFTVRALAAHLGRSVWLVEQYLDGPVPDDPTEVGDAAGYFLALLPGAAPDPDLPLNAGVRQRGEEDAADGPEAVLARVDETLGRLEARLPTLPDGHRIGVGHGIVLDVDEYLVTRIVELTAHTDDLAVSIGVPTPDPDPAAATLAVHCLVTLARRRHGDRSVLRALTRRERDADEALRAF